MSKQHLAHLNLPHSPLNRRPSRVDALRGVVQFDPPRTKVALVGAGRGRDEAPLEDPSWEVWALNAVPPVDLSRRLRCDRWFEMHVRSAQNQDDMAWIKQCPVPIYLPPTWAERELAKRYATSGDVEVPNAVRYPLENVESNLGSYFACTFAYQLALVLLEGVADTVGLFGVDLCGGTRRERTVEWACVSWWLGFCEGKGLTVELPHGSMLGRHFARYGIEYYEEAKLVNEYVGFMDDVDRRRFEIAAAKGITEEEAANA